MKFNWSLPSRRKIETIERNLATVLETALSISPFDITVVYGSRSEEAQTKAFKEGNSKVRWPNSRHNCPNPGQLSRAVDIAPYINGGIPWKDEGTFYCLAGVMMASSNLVGVEISYGGDWNNNGLTEDQTFFDLGHFYLTHLK